MVHMRIQVQFKYSEHIRDKHRNGKLIIVINMKIK